MRVICRRRGNIWRCWRVIPDAPRIVLEVSFVTRINYQRHFSWQAIFGEVGGYS